MIFFTVNKLKYLNYVKSEIRTDKNPRGLTFSGILRYATFKTPESILLSVYQSPSLTRLYSLLPTKNWNVLSCYAQFYNCQIPFQTNRSTVLRSKTMELKVLKRYICMVFKCMRKLINQPTISPPTLNLISVKHLSSKCSINTGWMDN